MPSAKSVISSIVDAIEGVTVSQMTAVDKLSHIKTFAEISAGRDRQFLLRPTSGPDKYEKYSGHEWLMRMELVILYNESKGAIDRIVDDARVIDEAVRGLDSTVSGVSLIEVEPTQTEYNEGLITHSRPFLIRYQDA